MTEERRAGARRAWPGRLLVIGSGLASLHCAHYNALYNGRAAAARADQLFFAQQEDSARVWYRRAADAAETILAVRDTNDWTPEVYLLATRGRAMEGACEEAHRHWREWLARSAPRYERPPAVATQLARGELALAVCDLGPGATDGAAAAAFRRLRTLNATADSLWPQELRLEIRRWYARAALATGAPRLADSLLRQLDDDSASWEHLLAGLETSDWTQVASRLRERLRRGLYSPALDAAIIALGRHGSPGNLERVEAQLARPGAAGAERARLLLLVGDAWMNRGERVRARSLYASVSRGQVTDSLLAAQAALRTLALDVRALAMPDSVAPRLAVHEQQFGGTGDVARLRESLRLFLVLHESRDASGAAHFLAGEVARDRLRAPLLARAVWQQLLSEYPRAPLSPRALAALSLLDGTRQDAWRTELQARYPESAEARWQRGESIVDAADYRAANSLLDGRWAIALREASRSAP